MLTFTFAAPRAPRCSHSCACVLSTFAEGAYAGSWNCDKCKTSARGERWFCQAHSEDYCFDCYPKVGQTEPTAAADPEPAAEAPAAEEPAAESVARQVVDALGEKRVLTAAEQAHFEDNRFRCPECTTVFCVLCDAAPYHLGFSCVGFSLAEGARKCRFCTATLTEHNLALDPVRSLPESAFHLRLYSNAAVIKMSYNSPARKSSAAEARTARSRRKSSPTAARRSTALLAAASAASKRCPAAMPAEAMRVTAVPTRPAWSAALVRQRLAPAARRSTR